MSSFSIGKLYGIRAGAYSVVVAATDARTASRAFMDWAKETHGVEISVMWTDVKKATSVNDRVLIIAHGAPVVGIDPASVDTDKLTDAMKTHGYGRGQ